MMGIEVKQAFLTVQIKFRDLQLSERGQTNQQNLPIERPKFKIWYQTKKNGQQKCYEKPSPQVSIYNRTPNSDQQQVSKAPQPIS